MSVFSSQVDHDSELFLGNEAAMMASLEDLQKTYAAMAAASETKRASFQGKGKRLPRDRIELLLDPGTPFIEICALAGYKCYDDKDGSTAGGGILAGIGIVAGIPVVVSANNSAVKGGIISPAGLQKSLRIQEIALKHRLPLITLAESGGANLNYAAEVFVEGARCFANQARLSAEGIPQITLVMGNATAGGAYQPGLSDYVIVVRGQAKMFLAGPPLLFAATGEIASEEELGGAILHAEISGTAEYLAEDDTDAIRYARDLIAKIALPWTPNLKGHKEPLYPASEIPGIVSASSKKPYDVRELIARLSDASHFLEFKRCYDEGTICGHAELYGQRLGIVGNNAPITTKGAAKAGQFIQLCDQAGIPLLFIHNTTGFMVGTDAEQGGIIKHGAKMLQAVTGARVPKIALIASGSYGAGNYAMCGRGFDPNFVFSWPTSRVAVMGGEQAGKVLRIVTEEKAKRDGKTLDSKMLDGMEAMAKAKIEKESTALYATSKLWDDGIIDPRDTRLVLGFLFHLALRPMPSIKPNTFGIPRF